MSLNGIMMSLNENLFLALIFFPNLIQEINSIKPQNIMKKLNSNLAVIKSIVTVFDNRKQPKRSTSTIFCTRF
jgi:hypothetical protein